MVEHIIAHDYDGKPHLVDRADLTSRLSVRAIAILNDEVLMVTCRRHNAKLEFPGGGVNEGESNEEALAREMREETGLEVVGEPIPVMSYQNYYYSTREGTAWDSTIEYYTTDVDGEIAIDDPDDDVVSVNWVELPLNRDDVKAEDALVLEQINPDYVQ